MPLPSAFHGVLACLRKATTLTATSFARPQTFTLSAGLQGNNSYSYMPLNTSVSYMPQPSTCSCCLLGLKPSNSPQASKATTLAATCPCHLLFRGFKPVLQLHAPAICFSGGSRLPFARPQTPQTPQTLPQASKGTTLTSIHAPAIRFSGGSRLPFARPQTPQTLPTLPWQQLLQPPKRFQPSRGNNSYSYIHAPPRQQLLHLYMPLPSVFQGVQDCRLPALKPPKPPKRFRRLLERKQEQSHLLRYLKSGKPNAINIINLAFGDGF